MQTDLQNSLKTPGALKRLTCFFAVLFFSASLCTAKSIVIANFDSGSEPFSIGGASGFESTNFNIVGASHSIHLATESAHGNTGYCAKIEFKGGGDPGWIRFIFPQTDLRDYRTLSFWVRGKDGGESCEVDIRGTLHGEPSVFRPKLSDFIIGGVSTQWKKVTIPLKVLYQEYVGGSYQALSDINAVILGFSGSARTLYIDDISFNDVSGNVIVDHFDDGNDPDPYNLGSFDWHDPPGSNATPYREYTTLPADAYGGSGSSYKVRWDTGTAAFPTDAVFGLKVDTETGGSFTGGMDVLGCNKISFLVRGEASADGELLGVALKDDNATENINADSVTITTAWQEVTRDLTAFSVSQSSVSHFQIWFNSAFWRGIPVNSTKSFTCYFDNIQFVDSSTPVAPSGLQVNGVNLTDDMVLCSTDVFSCSAQAGSADKTLERVRLEHDNLTDGVSWTTIGVDTDTTDGTYNFNWADFRNMSLILGNTYQIRAVAEDVAGNSGYDNPPYKINIKLKPNNPTVEGFQVYKTSIAVTLNPRRNPAGTTLTITTGAFESSSSSSAETTTGNSITLTITDLLSNATYMINARAYAKVASSSTLVSGSTTTSPVVPGGFAASTVYPSSVTVSWSPNTNSLTPPTSYELLISSVSDFSLTSSSITFLTQASSDTLSPNTTYYFKVRAFSCGDRPASDYNDYIATVTKANCPTLSSFQVFTSSIAVRLSANGNPNQTYIALSTNSAGTFISSAGYSGGSNIDLTIGNLAPNTTFNITALALNMNQQPSSTTVIITTATLPAVPINPTFLNVSFSSVTVQWERNGNPLTPPTSYQLQIATSSDFSGTITSSTTFLTQASTEGLSANSSIHFRLLTCGVGGSSSPLTTVISTVTASYAPGSLNFQIFTTSAAVTLAPNGNSAGTTLTLSTSASFETSASSSGVIGSENMVLVISNLTANSAYTLRARSLNFVNVPSSTTIVASTATLPVVPGAITINSVQHNQISISWDPNGNSLTPPTSYQVQVSSAQDSGFASYTTSDTFRLTFSSVSLSPKTTYFFRVLAFGVGGTDIGYNAYATTITLLSPSSAPIAPSNLTVTAISSETVSLSWSDNSNNEDGFKVISAGVLLGSAPIDATSLTISSLTLNTFIASAQVLAFNSAGASTGTAIISSYTLVNAPTGLRFYSVGIGNASLTWDVNGNPSSVAYEVTQSTTGDFATVYSTPAPFSSSLTSNIFNASGLASGVTYFFRVRAQNGDAIATAFTSPLISTAPGLTQVTVSTGGSVNVGGTSMVADPGTSITINMMADGTTQQILISTQTASVVYSNGIALQLPAGVSATVFATENNLQLTSTQTVVITNAGQTIEATSGTVSLQTSAGSLEIVISSTSPQDLQLVMITTANITIAITLNPPSGAIKTTLSPGTLAENVRLRAKIPGSLPAAPALRPAIFNRSAQMKESELLMGSPSVLTSFGIGLEITLDKAIQPQKTVPITMSFHDADIGNADLDTLVLGRYEDSVQKWLPITTSIDKTGKQATGFTNHFSKFQLMSLAPATDVSGAKIFPNPLQMHKSQNEMTFTNMTANASIKIYTYSGELVRRLFTDATGTVRWDAKNNYGETVASGIYIALIEGASESEKMVKIAVEK